MNRARARASQLKFLNRLELVSVVLLYLVLVALTLIRIDMTDTPWHLATARYAFESGHWPVHNTFSYTFPDYPLYQQYPIYQTLLYAAFLGGGWKALSILHCALWIVIFTLFVQWLGSWKTAAKWNVIMLLALLGLRERMVLRPDVITLLLVIVLLLLIDAYRRGKEWSAWLFIVVQFFMVNTHQLFPIGLAVQGAFLIHVLTVRALGGRWGISASDSTLAIQPIALALMGSILVCFATPIGSKIIYVTSQTSGSLAHHREHVQEFAPFYSSVLVVILVIFFTLFAYSGFWRNRKNWRPFDVMLWLMGSVLLMAAIRGTPYYILACAALFFRRSGSDHDQSPLRTGGLIQSVDFKILSRTACVFFTIAICITILYSRWVTPSRILGGTQPGIGLALGVWPRHSIRFLKENPPGGRMLNLSWYSGNPLIMEMFPSYPVFVDPRFEAYPRDFLLKVIHAGEDRETLENFILAYHPNWMVMELGLRSVRKIAAQLVKEGNWVPVCADTIFVILVRNAPENLAYISRHRLRFEDYSPPDFLTAEPDLLALQQLRMAGFYRDLGLIEKAKASVDRIKSAALKYAVVRQSLKEFRVFYPGVE